MVAKSTKPPSSMHIVQIRTQSFSKPIKVNNKTKLRWPHTRPIPEDLALAGFYYYPYEGADDNVCCYLCGKNMGGWEDTDDPLKEHLRGNNSCAWAVLRDLLVRSKNGEEFGEDVEDPKSEKMNELREATFGKWWPHDDKKGWNPKSKKMAKAGFYYTPTDDSEDMVNCPYCLIGLDGWEPKDDPLKEHKSRTPTCPFFVGLSGSAPGSNVSSPVKSVTDVPIKPQSSRKPAEDENENEAPAPPPKQNKNKRRMTRQAVADADENDEEEEGFVNLETTPPPSKRRKSTRVTSQSSQPEEPVLSPPRASRRISSSKPPIEGENKGSHRKSRRATTTPKPRVSSIKPDTHPIEVAEEEEEVEKPAPIANRRVTRSAPSPTPEEAPTTEKVTTTKKKTPVKPKGKHTRTKSNRNVSALSKIVSEVDKQSRRKSQQAAPIVEPTPEPIPVPEPVEEEDEEEEEPVVVPKKKRGRQTKIRDSEVPVKPVVAATPEKPAARRTRQSIVPEQPEQSAATEAAIPEKPAKAIVVPKRKRAGTRSTRTVSTAVKEVPEVDETETTDRPNVRTRLSLAAVPVEPEPEPESEPTPTPEVESVIAEPEPEPVEQEKIVAPAPRGRTASRGRGRGRGRGRSSTVRTSTVPDVPEEDLIVVPAKLAATRRGVGSRASKRDISAVYDDIPEETVEPPSKRKASGLRSIQKIPTPSEDSASDIYEDTKSTFSDTDEPAVVTNQPRRTAKRSSRLPSLRPGSRAKQGVTSEDRETEDEPSTIYHSADDYLSSPTHSTAAAKVKSKREMVDNAKKELQEEIWREKVANGEIGIGGSSEDDEKENANAEEKGKKPTRTVRGKGAKGAGTRKGKQNGKKKGAAAQLNGFAEDEDESSAGESHALVVKAMISPLKPGPAILEADIETEASSAEEETTTSRFTPLRGAPTTTTTRKVLNWTPAKIEDITPAPMPTGDLAPEEEEMTVEEWMNWVIQDEIKRLQDECEKLVKNLEKEGDRARRVLENLV